MGIEGVGEYWEWRNGQMRLLTSVTPLRNIDTSPQLLPIPTAHRQLLQCSPAVFLDVCYGMPKSSGN